MSNRRLIPFPTAPAKPATGLSVTAKIESPTGWLDLNVEGRYKLEAGAFGERATTWRRQETVSPYLDGTYVVSAVRESVTETLAVYVYAIDHIELAARITALTNAFGQLSYRLMLRVEGSAVYWTCQPADFTVTIGRELLHAKLALVKASVPRHPVETVVIAAGDEQ